MSTDKSEIQTAILTTLAQIPKGKVSTYGQVAERAGCKGKARYVGYLLRNLPKGSNIPWHRVIKSSGHLAFLEHSKPFEIQREKLESEGILVTQGRVKLSTFLW